MAVQQHLDFVEEAVPAFAVWTARQQVPNIPADGGFQGMGFQVGGGVGQAQMPVGWPGRKETQTLIGEMIVKGGYQAARLFLSDIRVAGIHQHQSVALQLQVHGFCQQPEIAAGAASVRQQGKGRHGPVVLLFDAEASAQPRIHALIRKRLPAAARQQRCQSGQG